MLLTTPTLHLDPLWRLAAAQKADPRPEALNSMISVRAAGLGPDDWVIAAGFNPVLLHGAQPDPDALDRAS